MKRAGGLFVAVLIATSACSQSHYVRYAPTSPPRTSPLARVFLIGDGGLASFRKGAISEPPAGGEKKAFKEIVEEATALAVKNARESRLLQTLKSEALDRERLAAGAVPLIVWLGDNVYEHGVPRDPGDQGYRGGRLTPVGLEYVRSAATVVVQAQVAVEAKANAVFVPGNHDWDHALNAGPEGRERIIEEGEVIRRYVAERRAHGGLAEGTDIRLLPPGGCPGPVETDVPMANGARVRIAAIDTEWLLTKDPDVGCVPGGPCRPCHPGSAQAVYDALGAIARSTGPRDAMLVVGHHPLRTYGRHGARAFWNEPKSWVRWLPLSQEDASHPRNRQLREGLASAWSADNDEPLLYAAGHDHNLQVIHVPLGRGESDRERTQGPFCAVSGSASKAASVGVGEGSLFADDEHGYMVVDFFEDGRVLLYVVEVPANNAPIRRYPPVEIRAARPAPASPR